MPGSPRSSRGLALVTVLWVLVLLSLMAASFTAATRTEINLTRNLIENAQAESLAEAGLARAILGLLADRYNIEFGDEGERLVIEPPDVGGALEAQPDVPVAAADSDASAPLPDSGAGGAWRADGTVYAWTYGGGAIRVAVQSEAGKIDLNTADDSLLRDLFLSASWTGPDGEPEGIDEAGAGALTDAVRDFADPDDLTRLNGAEDRDYAAAGLPWDAKDAPFEAVAELQQVLGMTALLYAAVAPALTIYTGATGVDARLAPRDVLLALPGGEAAGVVDDYLASRAEAATGAAPAFPGAEGSRRSRARVYTIHAEARLASGAVFVREAVVRLAGGPQTYRVEAWRQGARRLFP
jgi:general secretion pathway protein K